MAKDIEMDVNEKVNSVITFLGVAGVVALEEMMKHPIGAMSAIVGLLFVYDRWQTQRIIRKREQLKLDEDERLIRASKEHKEGAKD